MQGAGLIAMKHIQVLSLCSSLSQRLMVGHHGYGFPCTAIRIKTLQRRGHFSAGVSNFERTSPQPQTSNSSHDTWSSELTDDAAQEVSESPAAPRRKPRHSATELTPLSATDPDMVLQDVRGWEFKSTVQDLKHEEPRRSAFVNYLQLTDSEILKQCQMDTYRASGPGGQHRNKTESAVRLRHGPTGLTSQSCEERSQHINKTTALKRLRQNLALKVRNTVDLSTYMPSPELLRILPASALSKLQISGKQRIGPNHPDFLNGARELLDIVAAAQGSVSDAAAALGISTGALSKVITSDKMVLQEVNDLRALKGLKHLR